MNFLRSSTELAVGTRSGSLGARFSAAAGLSQLSRHPATRAQKGFQQPLQIDIRIYDGKMQSKSGR